MSNNFNRFFVDFDWLYQTTFVEEIMNINIAQLIIEGHFKIENVISENVVNENVNTVDFSTLTWNSIKDLINLDNVPKVTEGVLNTFAFSDYTVIIVINFPFYFFSSNIKCKILGEKFYGKYYAL